MSLVILPRVLIVSRRSLRKNQICRFCWRRSVAPSLLKLRHLICHEEELEGNQEGFDASDTAIDREKDSIELRLAKLCLEENIPYLGICRGSQVAECCFWGLVPFIRTLKRRFQRKIHGVSKSEGTWIMLIMMGHRHVVKVVEKHPFA
ncbi:hypothetical protein NC652_038864 [Populus alba x Populus x berolinensis]|nr:hypothetical protein NC652_038864 [Populus alba x Populus x berolinensis]